MATADRKQLTALVTGVSSGIGAAFAERLEALAQRLREERGVEVDVLAADLADPVELRTVEERIKTTENLKLLVNNAGFSRYMPFVELDPDRAESLIRLQIVAPTRLTRGAARDGRQTRWRDYQCLVAARLQPVSACRRSPAEARHVCRGESLPQYLHNAAPWRTAGNRGQGAGALSGRCGYRVPQSG
jgi:NAD(P)-dependent dehydrogenase (short-subunit alcohol dehydrogenase family)